MDIFLIKKPRIAEKPTDLKEAGKYVFIVKPSANKNEVKKAVKEIYNVDVLKVNIVNLPEKPKRFRNLSSYKSGVKKALVTLKKGQKIEI